jgi:hypothetical protein
MVEARRTAGSIVHSKAKNVISVAECWRRYGAQAETKMLNGQVRRVRSDRHPVSGRNRTMVEINFYVGGTMYKNVILLIINVRNGPFAEGRYDGFERYNPNWVPDAVDPVPNAPLLLQQQEQQPEQEPPNDDDGDNSVSNTSESSSDSSNNGIITNNNNNNGIINNNNNNIVHNNNNNNNEPVVTVHNVEWFTDDNLLLNDINGVVPTIPWSLQDSVGNIHQSGMDNVLQRSRLDFFFNDVPTCAICHYRT